MRVTKRVMAMLAIVGLCLMGLSTVASASNPVGSAKWCKNHPNSKLAACKTGGGGGTGGTPPPPPTITVTLSPNSTADPLLEVGNSEIYAVVQVETSPSFENDPVVIESQQLANACGGAVLFGSLQPGAVYGADSVTVFLDSDGNATVSLYGLDCAPGQDLIDASLVEAPYYTATTVADVLPPNVTPPGVTGFPADEVETGNTSESGESDVYAVFYVETDPVYAEQTVDIDSAQLFGRCLGPITPVWISNQGSFGTAVASATLDNDGNAVFAFSGSSCAPGDSTVVADVDAGIHSTYSTTFTIVAPTHHLMKARLALAVGCATGLLLALPALPAGAKPVAVGNTYYVNSATDTGAPDCPSANNSDCGIDDAIAAFNNDTTANDSDTIVFSTAVTTFTVGGPTAISNTTTGVTLTITGNGPAATIVSGNKVNRVFQVDPGTTVSISELTIEDGQAPAGTAGPTLGDTSSPEQIDESDATVDVGFNNGGDGGNGGGVDNLGTLSLSDDDVLGNSAGDGGAPGPVGLEYVGNDDQIDLADGGTGSAGGNGGGIYNAAGGSLTLTDDAVAQNTAGSGPTNNQSSWTVFLDGNGGAVNFGAMGAKAGQGGGIYNAGTLVAQNDTIAGNKSGSAGGFDPSFAVGVVGGDTSVLNFLIPETTGPSGGGGGGIYNTATASVTSATVAGNTTGSGGDESGGFGTTGPAGTGGGLDNTGGDLNLQASIVAKSSGNDCAGTITDDGYNIDDDGNCGFTTPSVSDSTTLDSSLGSLAANGGPTSTIALTAGPAVGLVNSASVCALPDQRGVARPTPVCDSGAFELTPVGPTITVTPSTLPNATAEFLYSEQLAGNGGSTPYTFSVTSGPLPSWLTLTSAGLLSGIPPSTTPVSFTVQAKDAGGYTGSQAYTLTIVAPTITVTPAPPIANATWESPYTPVDFGATGGVGPYGFSYSGALPTGLTLSAAGVLAGTPTNKAQIGDVFTFTVTATDQGSFTGTRTGYSIRLGSPCGSGLTPYFLTAKSGTGNFTGIFCVASSGSATYTQYSPTHTVTATGTGTVTVSGSVTHITAFGADLALIGQSAGTFSTYTETAPLRSGGTYTLS